MTDFCHTHLRKNSGIPKAALRKKFAASLCQIIADRLEDLIEENYIEQSNTHWFFSNKGRNLSNLVFEKLCFSKSELNFSSTQGELYAR